MGAAVIQERRRSPANISRIWYRFHPTVHFEGELARTSQTVVETPLFSVLSYNTNSVLPDLVLPCTVLGRPSVSFTSGVSISLVSIEQYDRPPSPWIFHQSGWTMVFRFHPGSLRRWWQHRHVWTLWQQDPTEGQFFRCSHQELLSCVHHSFVLFRDYCVFI